VNSRVELCGPGRYIAEPNTAVNSHSLGRRSWKPDHFDTSLTGRAHYGEDKLATFKALAMFEWTLVRSQTCSESLRLFPVRYFQPAQVIQAGRLELQIGLASMTSNLGEPIEQRVAQSVDAQPLRQSDLGSNSNYVLFSGCKPLTDLSVSVHITKDVVCHSSSGRQKGFSFQMNAYSPKIERTALQQYVIALIGSELIGAVDNWPTSGPNTLNAGFNLMSLPSSTLPAGYRIEFSLLNDLNGTIIGIMYGVTDDQGMQKASVSKSLQSLPGVTKADLAPIIAFQLNLVGPIAGESVVLSSGEGNFVYSASTALTPVNQEPPCAESGYVTAETSNSRYGVLVGRSSNSLTQSFSVDSRPTVIRKGGKTRPSSNTTLTSAKPA
jgi:hypothetical protein